MLLLVMKMVSKHLCQYICFSKVGYVVVCLVFNEFLAHYYYYYKFNFKVDYLTFCGNLVTLPSPPRIGIKNDFHIP